MSTPNPFRDVPVACHDWLFRSAEATFRSDFNSEDSVALLRRRVVSPVRSLFRLDVAVGTVSVERVKLRWACLRFLGRTSPEFRGAFRRESGGVFLVGQFATSLPHRIFSLLILGISAFMALILIMEAFVHPARAWFMPLFGLAFFALIIGFIKLEQWSGWRDVPHLTRVIKEALSKAQMMGVPR